MHVVDRWTGRRAMALCAALRMSSEEFAQRLGAAPRTVSYWESRPASKPNPTMQAALDTMLESASEASRLRFELLLKSEQDDSGIRADAALSPAADSDVSDLEAWELADALTRSSISPHTLAQMERAALGYAVRYPSSVPAALMRPVRQQLRRLQQALNQPQAIQVRRRAVRLVGVLSGIAGNLSLDIGNEDQAVTFFQLGKLAGHEAEDDDLTAWVLATHSIAPFFANRSGDATALLDQASELAHGASSLRRRAWVEALRARAHAAAGNRTISLAALDEARAAIAAETDPPHGTDFFDGPRLDGLAGGTYLLLRQAEPAAELLVQALGRRSPADTKGRALITLDLAAARVIANEPEEASRLATEALDLASGSIVHPIVTRAVAVRADMQRWEATRPVAELDAQLAEITRRNDRRE